MCMCIHTYICIYMCVYILIMSIYMYMCIHGKVYAVRGSICAQERRWVEKEESVGRERALDRRHCIIRSVHPSNDAGVPTRIHQRHWMHRAHACNALHLFDTRSTHHIASTTSRSGFQSMLPSITRNASKHHKKPSNHRPLTPCELCLRVCARERMYIDSV